MTVTQPNYRPKFVGKPDKWDGTKEYGRLRIYEDASRALDDILRIERDRLTLQRRQAIEDNPEVSTASYNRQIKLVDQILDELERTRADCGW